MFLPFQKQWGNWGLAGGQILPGSPWSQQELDRVPLNSKSFQTGGKAKCFSEDWSLPLEFFDVEVITANISCEKMKSIKKIETNSHLVQVIAFEVNESLKSTFPHRAKDMAWSQYICSCWKIKNINLPFLGNNVLFMTEILCFKISSLTNRKVIFHYQYSFGYNYLWLNFIKLF